MIRRDETGERERSFFIDADLSNADPFGLQVGRFYDRHPNCRGAHDLAVTEEQASKEVEKWTRGAHLVGAVTNFDADCLDKMLRRHRLIPAWHYHLVDVEAMAVGYLAGVSGGASDSAPPWKSDDLSRKCGVEPPADDERHTALGDARWALRWYDSMVGAS